MLSWDPPLCRRALARSALQDYLFEVASLHLSQVLEGGGGGGEVITSLLNWVLYAPASLKSALTAALKCDPDRKVPRAFGDALFAKKLQMKKAKRGTRRRATITQSADVSARLNPESCFLVVQSSYDQSLGPLFFLHIDLLIDSSHRN